MVDTDVVNDVTCMRQSVITPVVIRSLWHDVTHRITAMSYEEFYSQAESQQQNPEDVLLPQLNLSLHCFKHFCLHIWDHSERLQCGRFLNIETSKQYMSSEPYFWAWLFKTNGVVSYHFVKISNVNIQLAWLPGYMYSNQGFH